MPDPSASDPHSAIVDGKGTVWFTLQRANMIGRLDPTSGKVDLVTAPTANSRPYGIKLELAACPGWPPTAATGSTVSIPSMEITEFELPDANTTVRRLDFASDDTIWYVNSALGRLGHLDPATGEAREWDSPSGERSHPYAIAVIDDVVWYNESGQRPDALVRFDPAAETFQSWAIPRAGSMPGSSATCARRETATC
jgi:virginiamycin B lyase